MVKAGKKAKLPNQDSKTPSSTQGAGKPLPAAVEDEEIQDGDIATPKHDRHGDDDQPL
jgi:hypothetical protein